MSAAAPKLASFVVPNRSGNPARDGVVVGGELAAWRDEGLVATPPSPGRAMEGTAANAAALGAKVAVAAVLKEGAQLAEAGSGPSHISHVSRDDGFRNVQRGHDTSPGAAMTTGSSPIGLSRMFVAALIDPAACWVALDDDANVHTGRGPSALSRRRWQIAQLCIRPEFSALQRTHHQA